MKEEVGAVLEEDEIALKISIAIGLYFDGWISDRTSELHAFKATLHTRTNVLCFVHCLWSVNFENFSKDVCNCGVM
jgi:hypothetical protein